MALPPVSIFGMDAGLKKNVKPFLLIDSAFQELNNAYAFRGRIKKREGIKLTGRLRRVLTGVFLGNTIGAQLTYNFTFAIEPTAELQPGSLVITIGAPDNATFTDNGNGTFTVTGVGVAAGSFVNYATANVNLVLSASIGGAAINADVNYFPSLPVMGIDQRELPATNTEQTAFFDEKYVYAFNGSSFSSPSSTVWAGDDTNFFWMANFRGATPQERLFFVTNFAPPATDVNNRIRYTPDLATWTTFTPPTDKLETTFIWQCRLIIPYYGRLLFLNVWEGPDAGTAANIFNRCRFSQVGNPIQSNGVPGEGAWLSDVFGKGGFIDAPTSEAIISCRFYKNVLIVFFERSTWLLRYVGEYGLPFIWERISSDFGSESTFSTVLFDQGVLAIGDKAIISADGNNAQRIDLDIPDQVFQFGNLESGTNRVQGSRDFDKELVYWCYPDGSRQANFKFPSNVLIYNYRNNTWAKLRDNVTAFGILQTTEGDSWDAKIPWDSDTSWDDFIEGEFPLIVSGNQQGYIHYYQYPELTTPAPTLSDLIEDESLSITAITRSATAPLRIEVRNHNLVTGEIIFIVGMHFIDTATSTPLATSLNNQFYQVVNVDTGGSVDPDLLDLYQWNIVTQTYETTAGNVIFFTPATGIGTYIGGGQLCLIPKMEIETKDFNPFQTKGKQVKLTHIDFQTDSTPNSSIAVNVQVDAAPSILGNLMVGNQQVEQATNQFGQIINATQTNPCVITSPNHGILNGEQITIRDVLGMTNLNGGSFTITFIDVNTFSLNGIDATGFPAYIAGGQWIVDNQQGKFYVPGSAYSWHRFYATAYGQYITLLLTYDDALMNQAQSHEGGFELNAMNLYFREGGRINF